MAISDDGSIIGLSLSADHPDRRLLIGRDPQTGSLRRIGVSRRCVAVLDGPCAPTPGIASRDLVKPLGTGSQLVLGSGTGGGGGLAVLGQDPASGAWRQLPGPGGCVDATGAGGCTKLPCMDSDATLAATSVDQRYLYVAGGYANPESTSEGYLATFARAPDGSLTPAGCVRTGHDRGAGFAPVWISSLPYSSTVLMLQVRGNRGDGIAWGRMFASAPGAGGALGKPRQITGDLDLGPFGASLSLSSDGRTLYGADTSGGGSLEAFRVTPTSLRRLPAPWGTPYRASQNRYRTLIYGATASLLSPDGRFLYLALGSSDPSQDPRGPAIRVLRLTSLS